MSKKSKTSISAVTSAAADDKLERALLYKKVLSKPFFGAEESSSLSLKVENEIKTMIKDKLEEILGIKTIEQQEKEVNKLNDIYNNLEDIKKCITTTGFADEEKQILKALIKATVEYKEDEPVKEFIPKNAPTSVTSEIKTDQNGIILEEYKAPLNRKIIQKVLPDGKIVELDVTPQVRPAKETMLPMPGPHQMELMAREQIMGLQQDSETVSALINVLANSTINDQGEE